MALPFFDKDAENELTLRILRGRESEDERHREKKSEIGADHRARGLQGSTAYTTALLSEEMHHLRELSRISRDAVFEIVEGRQICLKDSDISSIVEFLEVAFRRAAESTKREHDALSKARGLPSLDQAGFEHHVNEAIEQEARVAVGIRAMELRRKQDAERKEKRSGRTWSILKLVIAAVLTILAAVAVRWLITTLSL